MEYQYITNNERFNNDFTPPFKWDKKALQKEERNALNDYYIRDEYAFKDILNTLVADTESGKVKHLLSAKEEYDLVMWAVAHYAEQVEGKYLQELRATPYVWESDAESRHWDAVATHNERFSYD